MRAETREVIKPDVVEAEEGAVSASNLVHTYLGSQNPALEVKTFSISEGEAVLIAGKSGSGKSTLVNCINGVIPHIFPGDSEISEQVKNGTISGDVSVYEHAVRSTPLATLSTVVGTLLQDPETQVLNYKAEEEVAFGPENLCLPRDEIIERVNEAVEIAGIRHLLDRETYTLSGGELQRVALAAVIAMRPRILIFDEPTSNIDPEGTEAIFEFLKKIKGKSMIIVEHKLERILPFVDRIVLVDDGKIVFNVKKEDLMDNLDTLLKAGVEVPDYFVHAREMNLRTAELSLVTKELKRRGIKLHTPERKISSTQVMTAKAKVSSGEKVLVDAEITVGQGELVALMGRNGAGKSTFLKSVMGFVDKQLNSAIYLNVSGVDLSRAGIQKRGKYVAFVPQAFDLTLIQKNVEAEVSYSLRKRGEKDWKSRTEAMLEIFDLKEVRERDPLTLSMGQRRRVAMAGALSSGARVVMLDEPTSGQDFHNREMLAGEIDRLRQLGYSFLVVTHDSRFVYRHADRLIILSDGKKVLDATPDTGFRDSGEYGIPPPSDYLLRA